ncbi:MAG: hypothetical protein RPR91_00560 [Colwellia sp.]
MKVSRKIKSAVIVSFALLAGSMSFQASAYGHHFCQHQAAKPSPRYHFEWRYDWVYDCNGNRYGPQQWVKVYNRW